MKKSHCFVLISICIPLLLGGITVGILYGVGVIKSEPSIDGNILFQNLNKKNYGLKHPYLLN